MLLDRNLGTSLHRQVFLLLRDEIARGEYNGSGALPKEEALCERFNVSRATVRRALENLAALGMVERRHGIGTFVRAELTLPRIGPSLNFVESLKQVVDETEVEVLSVGQELPAPEIRRLLQIEANTKAMHAMRLRRINGTPVMLTDAWLPPGVSKPITAEALRKRGLHEILLAQGVRFGRVVQEIGAQSADPMQAAQLEIEIGSPLLRLVRLLHDAENRPVQYLTVYTASERSRLLMDIGSESMNSLSSGQFVHDVATRSRSGAKLKSKRMPQ